MTSALTVGVQVFQQSTEIHNWLSVSSQNGAGRIVLKYLQKNCMKVLLIKKDSSLP
jgi:hypothetical protein